MKSTGVLNILIVFTTVQIIAVPLPYEDSSETSGENRLGLLPTTENEQTGEDIQSKIQQPSPSPPRPITPVVVRQVSTPVFTHLPAQPLYTPLNPGVVNHHVHNSILTDALYKSQLRQHLAQNQAKFKQVGTSLQQLHGMVKNVDRKTSTVIKETRRGFTETHSKIDKSVNKGTEDLIKVIESLNQLRSTVEANEARFANDLNATEEHIKRVEQAANKQVTDLMKVVRELQQIVTNPLLPGTGPVVSGIENDANGDSKLALPTDEPNKTR